MNYTYRYWRPQATVDIVVLKRTGDTVRILLVRRGNDPFKGYWAMPGGFIDQHDGTLSDAAMRELREETGITGVRLTQIGAWGSKGRDPRDWTVTVVFGAVLPGEDARLDALAAADDATGTGWFDTSDLPPLAFDHERVIPCALETLLRGAHAIGGCDT